MFVMQDARTFTYKNGGRVSRTARIEPGEEDGCGTLVLDVLDKTYRVPIRFYACGAEAAPAVGGLCRKVTTPIAELSYALLHAFRQVWKQEGYGAAVAFEIDGRRLIARYQEHPPDAGIGRPHPGVTVFEEVCAAA
jgi:hypothetical protein